MIQTSATGKRDAEAGFTLTELLAVLAILGLLASAVLMAAPDSGRNLADEAESLGAGLLRAKEEAVLTGRTVEVRITPRGYGFEIRRGATRLALAEPPFRAAEWERDTTAMVDGAGDGARISFDSTGIASPARIDLYRDNVRVRVSVDAGGDVRIDVPAR